jgi:hypothetical protein
VKSLLIGLVAFPFFATGASAAEQLGAAQLDRVVAGEVGIPGLDCPVCSFATSTSNSNNGVTTTTSSTGVTSPPPPPPPDNGGGGGGGNGGGGPTVIISLGGPAGLPPGAATALQTLLGGTVILH